MATVNFLYRSTKNQANLVLRLLHRHNETDLVIGAKTKYLIDKDYWNNTHKKTRLRDIDLINKQVEVNTELNNIEKHILGAFNSANINEVSKEWLQTQIDYYYNPTTNNTILSNRLTEYIDYYIECKRHELTTATITKYNTIKSKVELMETYIGKAIYINEVDESFKNEFIKYYKHEKYSTNTIQRELAFIKTFCRHARNNGLETSTQLDGLILKKAKVEKIYLTFDEIQKIEQTKYDNIAHENAKNWLIISCYTGQRVSDFLNFTKDMIRVEDGITLIEFTQKKTNKRMSLALHPKVVKVLNKNKGEFPYRISDQRYNEYIKKVCQLAGISQKVKGSKMGETKPNSKVYRKESGMYPKFELVTSHIGRRSFATNFYGKIPTSLLISATGHSTEAMYLEYVGKSQTQQAKELAKYW